MPRNVVLLIVIAGVVCLVVALMLWNSAQGKSLPLTSSSNLARALDDVSKKCPDGATQLSISKDTLVVDCTVGGVRQAFTWFNGDLRTQSPTATATIPFALSVVNRSAVSAHVTDHPTELIYYVGTGTNPPTIYVSNGGTKMTPVNGELKPV